MTDQLRTGRLERALSLARVGARTGATFLTSVGSEAAAAQALKVLGNLRGIAAKVGQTLSYVDGVVPEKHRAAYEIALRELQRAAPTSPYTDIRATLEEELGAGLPELFAEFAEVPIASASIGQVHRARLHSGEIVAVKVQHSGIEQAFESDLSNVGSLKDWMKWMLPGALDPSSMVSEVIARFREELDYVNEARNLEAFGELWSGSSAIHLPQVMRSHTTRRVFTTTWLVGDSLETAALAPLAEREVWAREMWRFIFRSILVGGAFHADPHPGNYAFLPGGEIVVYDFGCVQRIPEVARQAALHVHGAAAQGDPVAFRNGLREMINSRQGAFEDAMAKYVELCFQPIFDSPFRITRTWVTSLTESVQSSKKLMLSKGANVTLPPPHLAMMNRLQFGFYSVLARLDVEVDYRAIEEQILSEAREAQVGSIAARIAARL